VDRIGSLDGVIPLYLAFLSKLFHSDVRYSLCLQLAQGIKGALIQLCHIRYFLNEASAQSLTNASEALNVSQPSLSVQIRDLEEKLGTGYWPNGPARAQDDIDPSGQAVS
jgi:hypothetical protein